jgi:hypothetical protein
MERRNVLTAVIIFIAFSVTGIAQQSLNNYRYVVIPKQYGFLNKEDQYQLNSLTKFLFDKEGFTTFYDIEQKPEDLVINPCSGLSTRVKNGSGLFSTKLVIELVNCRGEVIFTSPEGKSKEKDYKRAYQEALRDAFTSISNLNYSYEPQTRPENVKRIEPIEKKKDVVNQVPVKVNDETPKIVKPTVVPADEAPKIDILYAQPNALGYQLVDNTPKVIYVLLKTYDDDLFILKDMNGIVMKYEGNWFAKFYEGNKFVIKQLLIKF